MNTTHKIRRSLSDKRQEDGSEEISSEEIQLQSRYRLIEALSTAERKASARVENLLEIVFEIDADGIVTFLNRAWEHSIGHRRDDVLGRALIDFVCEEDIAVFQSAVVHATVNKGCTELRIEHSAGHLVAVSMCLTSSTEEDGAFLGSFHDVTHDRDVREQLIVAKEAAENANRTKSEFLAAMSHEIRTPLNALLGMSDLLTLTELTPVQSRYLQSIQNNSEMLLALVCDILDVSKIEAELMEFESRPFSPSALLEEVAVSLAARSEAKGLELVVYCESTLPQSVLGDACRIRQVLLNIVGNAIKFTNEGDIVMSVSGEQREDSCWMLRFEVRDTGIGIAEDTREQIFERFIQGSSSTNREFGGTGLGLTISRSLVEMMGGRIDFQSRVGEGTTFYIELDLPMVEEPKAVQLPGTCDIRALVIEPNRAQREALAKTLSGWGIPVDSVSSLELALEVLRTQDCSLLFVDMHLCQSVSDCAMGSLRDYLEEHSICPILVGSMGQVGRANLSVLDDVATLSKPICSEPLLRVIMATLYPDEAETNKGALVAVSDTVTRGLDERILVVEDNRDNQFFIERVLEIAGYDVDIASTGAVGAQKAKENDYHLIVMDIEMPKMDGFACTQMIRSWEREMNKPPTPIIALTAHALSGYRERSIAVGMNDYLTKPICRKLLVDTVHSWITGLPVVLIVDDSDDSRLLIDRMLRTAGRFRILCADSGSQALMIVKQNAIAVVLLDVELPDMMGWEVATRVHSASPQTRIMTITAHDDPAIKARCLKAGSMAHVSKPVRLDSLLALMERVLPGGGPPLLAASEADEPTVVLRVNNDIADLVPRFLSNRQNDVDRLVTLVEARDFEGIRRIGHNWKGSGIGYGIPKISEFGVRLESAALKHNIPCIDDIRTSMGDYLARVQLVSEKVE